jgi:hypothetical protein
LSNITVGIGTAGTVPVVGGDGGMFNDEVVFSIDSLAASEACA